MLEIDFLKDKALGALSAPPVPVLNNISNVSAISTEDFNLTSTGIVNAQMPLRIKRVEDQSWFTFPVEPVLSVSLKNNIIKRKVAKGKGQGTIKERWSQDDYSITIKGVIINEEESRYPEEQVKRLLELCSAKESCEVINELLSSLNINYLAIESLSLPNTKGINNQAFEIKAVSDTNMELLIEI